jgi:GNAT superfamily N-acetyltransferase
VSEAAAIEIAPGDATDVPAVERLRLAAGWVPGERYLRIALASGAVLLLARSEDEIVASGCGLPFGETAFIGAMLVAEHMQRRGLGARIFAALLERLRTEGVARIELEATAAGRPLYERFGMQARWSSLGGVLQRPSLSTAPDPAIGPPNESAWHELLAIDARAFGGQRARYLTALAAEPDCTTLVYRAGGRVAGYGMRLSDRIGPLVAVSDHVAERLAAALAGGAPVGTRVALCGRASAPIWRRLGFELGPNDTRMTLGTPPNDSPEHMYALIVAGVG